MKIILLLCALATAHPLDGPDELTAAESRVDWHEAAAPAEAPAVAAPPRRHAHYSLGRRENDEDNLISNASLIRGAGVSGHLINAAPPVALAGSAKLWIESAAGKHGEKSQEASLWLTLILPVAIVALTVFVIIDNIIDAVSDAASPQPHWGIKAD